MNISSASGVCHTGQKVMHRAILYREKMYVFAGAEFIKFAQERKTFSIIHIKNIAQTY